MRLAAAALLLCLAATPAWACRHADYAMTAGQVIAIPDPHPIPLGRPFSLSLSACREALSSVSVDATMPAHRHGMNYRPVVTKVAPGDFRIDGLLFHMPGEWEFVFDVTYADGRRERLTHTVTVQ